ncbi:MAG: Hsp33 family molecular chaperone HslO [Deinococcota bacterium]
MSFLIRGLAANGGIRVVAADTTELVELARTKHNTSPTATAALGRSLTAGALLSHVLLKTPQDGITLRIDGGGPLGSITVEAGLDGRIRGFVRNPDIGVPLRDDGKLNVGAAVGNNGEFQVIRTMAPKGDPYVSSVPILTGEIAEDVSVFLANSEQINSAVLLGVYLETEGVFQAGGIIFQALPDADPAALDLLEANIRAHSQLTDAMKVRALEDIVRDLCWGLEFQLLSTDPFPLSLKCTCDESRILHALTYFDEAEREAMIAEDGGAEAICQWCNTRFWVTPDQLRALSAQSKN